MTVLGWGFVLSGSPAAEDPSTSSGQALGHLAAELGYRPIDQLSFADRPFKHCHVERSPPWRTKSKHLRFVSQFHARYTHQRRQSSVVSSLEPRQEQPQILRLVAAGDSLRMTVLGWGTCVSFQPEKYILNFFVIFLGAGRIFLLQSPSSESGICFYRFRTTRSGTRQCNNTDVSLTTITF